METAKYTMKPEDINTQFQRSLNRIREEDEKEEELEPERTRRRISISSEHKDKSSLEDSDVFVSTKELDVTCEDGEQELELANENFLEWQKWRDEAEELFSEWLEWTEATDHIKSRVYKLLNAACNQLIGLILWSRFPNTEKAIARIELLEELVEWWGTVSDKILGIDGVVTALGMVDARIRKTMKPSNKADDPLMIGFVDELTFRLAKEIVRLFVIEKFQFTEDVFDELHKCETELKKIESSKNWLKKQVKLKSSRTSN